MTEVAKIIFAVEDNEAITDTWIELAGWSRRDSIDLNKSSDLREEGNWQEADKIYAAILARRLLECSLQMADGSHFVDHANITADVLLDLDVAVAEWLPVAVLIFVGRHRQLGEAAGLKLLRTSAAVEALMKPEAENPTTTS